MGAALLGCCQVEGTFALNTLRDELAGTRLRMRREPEVWVTIEALEIKEGGNVKLSPQNFCLRALNLKTLVEVMGTRAELAALAAQKGAANALAKLKLDSDKAAVLAAKASGAVQKVASFGGGDGGPSQRSQRVEVTVDMDKTFGQEEVAVRVTDIKTEIGLITKIFAADVCKKFIEDAVSSKASVIATRVGKKKYEEVVYNVTAAACGRARRWAAPLRLLSELAAAELEPDTVAYNTAISACGRSREWSQALALLAAMRRRTVSEDVLTHNAVLAACALQGAGRPWALALHLLSRLRARALRADTASYNCAIAACDQGHRWAAALALLREMRSELVSPSVVTLNALASACERGLPWASSLALMEELRQALVEPDSLSHSAVATACAKASGWPTALVLLAASPRGGPRPRSAAMAACAEACGRDSAWRQALCLLRAGVARDVALATAAAAACGRAALAGLQRLAACEARRGALVLLVNGGDAGARAGGGHGPLHGLGEQAAGLAAGGS
ncbi:unnamed protein product, partial [Prorocentrum cordatum]